MNGLNSLASRLTIFFGLLMVAGFFVAVSGGSLPLPPEWLINWTGWLLSALGVVFAPTALVTTIQAVRRFAGLSSGQRPLTAGDKGVPAKE